MLNGLHHRLLRAAAKYVKTKQILMRNAAPLVSFTFDDVPDSAFLNGARVLDRSGVRGTFYIAAGTCGAQDEYWRVIAREQVAALHESGHEIGAHTFSHVNVQTLSAAEMAEETRRNDARLREICGDVRIENFAYPFGDVSIFRKLQLQREFASCRSIYEGINSGMIDLGLLKVAPLYGRSAASVPALLDEVVRTNGWLIFYSHDIADPPSWIGCTPELLGEAVALVKASGIEMVTVAEGLRAIGYRAPSESPVAIGSEPAIAG